jgi:hypothetical protein
VRAEIAAESHCRRSTFEKSMQTGFNMMFTASAFDGWTEVGEAPRAPRASFSHTARAAGWTERFVGDRS